MPEVPNRMAGGPARVVIVDDSVSVCKAIGRMLGPHGAEVLEMHSGEEALDRLARERPDLIICDLVLPDLEGIAICRYVREHRALGRVPLLAISGLATDEVRRQALAAGADAVLRKPFSGDSLIREVDALLARARGEVERALAVVPQPPPAALQVIAQLEGLPGLLTASWRLANGAAGTLRTVVTTATPPDPDAMLARLRSFSAPLGVGEPTLVLVEGDTGELLLVGHRARCGVLCLQLAESAILGKARFLARKFLRILETEAR